MTQPTHLINQVYAVEVPDGAENIRISQLIGTPKLIADIPGYLYAAKLSPGNWQLICTTKECTEEQAEGIVEREEGEFKDYECDEAVYMYAANSLRSLLTSKGLDPNKNYVLIKKVS